MKRLLRVVTTVAFLGGLLGGGHWLLTSESTPLPPEWNPIEPLDLTQRQTSLTGFKLRRALTSDETCLAALGTGATFKLMPPLEDSPLCRIAPRIELSRVGQARLDPLETACETALRLAVWEMFTVQPASETLGADVAAFLHQGSYNCRPIRGGTRMSHHATARAIDIRGVRLTDGRDIPLLSNWEGEGAVPQFWRRLRDGACQWFTTTLGPDFNPAHADHLHLQSGGWGTCR